MLGRLFCQLKYVGLPLRASIVGPGTLPLYPQTVVGGRSRWCFIWNCVMRTMVVPGFGCKTGGIGSASTNGKSCGLDCASAGRLFLAMINAAPEAPKN